MNLLRQTDKPLFPDVLWSRPENKRQAGKLLIIGGSAGELNEVANSYQKCVDFGIGEVKTVLPRSFEKLVGRSIEGVVYAGSTATGSFALSAAADLKGYVDWSDGILVAGSLGRNSETQRLLVDLVNRTDKPVVVSGDSLELFMQEPERLLKRERTALVANLEELGKLNKAYGSAVAVTSSMQLQQLAEALTGQGWSASVLTRLNGVILTASGDEASATSQTEGEWQTALAALCAVLSVQVQAPAFEIITTAAYFYNKKPGLS